jgi:hypothetical protein
MYMPRQRRRGIERAARSAHTARVRDNDEVILITHMILATKILAVSLKTRKNLPLDAVYQGNPYTPANGFRVFIGHRGAIDGGARTGSAGTHGPAD